MVVIAWALPSSLPERFAVHVDMNLDMLESNFSDLTGLLAESSSAQSTAAVEGACAVITGIQRPKPGKLRVRNPVRRSNMRTTYKYPCWKAGRMLQCESKLEMEAYYLLDAFPAVSRISEQAMRIDFEIDGQPMFHVPDVVLNFGRRVVILEIKEDEKAQKRDAQHRTHHLTPALARRGFAYRVLTESLIRRQPRLDNVDWLLRRGRPLVGLGAASEVRALLAGSGGCCSWGELLARNLDREAAQLVLHGKLWVDLGHPVSLESRVFLAEGAE